MDLAQQMGEGFLPYNVAQHFLVSKALRSEVANRPTLNGHDVRQETLAGCVVHT